MAPKEIFSQVFRYFFMFNGLPVYCPNARKLNFFFWYIWRISIVLRCNTVLFLFFYWIYIERWRYPFSLFGLMDVLSSAFVVNSLIGKHKRLIELQKDITDNLTKKKYRILPEDRFKMKIVQVFFGIIFLLETFTVGYSMHNYFEKIKETVDIPEISKAFKFFQILFLSATSSIATISYALYYCIFCKHLKAMYRSVNQKVERLRELTTIIQPQDDDSEFSANGECREEKASHDCKMTQDTKVIQTPTTCWTTDSFKNEVNLSLPQVNLTKKLHSLKSPDDIEKCRRFSCSVLGSSNLPNYPMHIQCILNNCCSSEQEVRQSNFLSRKIQRLNQKFASVSLLVQETDDLFSLQVLTILTITFFRSCCYIYIYASSDWYEQDCCAIISIVEQFFFDFLAFGSVAIGASLVKEEAQKFSPLIISVDEIYRSKSMRVQVQTDVAQLTVYSFDVQLTAWKFFTVSRSFIPTVIGVTATYILVIFQLQQIVQEGQCNLLKNVTDTPLLNQTGDYLRIFS